MTPTEHAATDMEFTDIEPSVLTATETPDYVTETAQKVRDNTDDLSPDAVIDVKQTAVRAAVVLHTRGQNTPPTLGDISRILDVNCNTNLRTMPVPSGALVAAALGESSEETVLAEEPYQFVTTYLEDLADCYPATSD